MTGGRSVLVRVHGRSGVGKSALVQRFLGDLADADRAVVLSGRCYEQESVPYKASTRSSTHWCVYLSGLSTAEVRALLPRDVGPLARVFPVLRRVEAVTEARRGAEIPDPQELRRRAFAALRDLLARLGDQRPLVVAIDDVQWGDIDSANLLAEILRPPDPPVLLLLASYRSEDAESSAFIRTLVEIAAAPDRAVEPMELAVLPLTPAESRELALTLLGGEGRSAWEKAEEVARESRGNPFFVAELVRHIQAGQGIRGGDRSGATETVDLDDVLWARILRLPDDARRLLEVVAVSGRPLRQADAFRCLEGVSDGRRALALLRSGRFARGVAGGEGEEIETYHDRVRETVVTRLAPEVLAEHHRRLASALEASGTPTRRCSAPTSAPRATARRRGATSPRRRPTPPTRSPSTARPSCTAWRSRCRPPRRRRSSGSAGAGRRPGQRRPRRRGGAGVSRRREGRHGRRRAGAAPADRPAVPDQRPHRRGAGVAAGRPRRRAA